MSPGLQVTLAFASTLELTKEGMAYERAPTKVTILSDPCMYGNLYLNLYSWILMNFEVNVGKYIIHGSLENQTRSHMFFYELRQQPLKSSL